MMSLMPTLVFGIDLLHEGHAPLEVEGQRLHKVQILLHIVGHNVDGVPVGGVQHRRPLVSLTAAPERRRANQHQVQQTSIKYSTPASSTANQHQVQQTSIKYNKPASSTAHQHQVQHTSTKYSKPVSSTTNQHQVQQTSIKHNKPP